MFVVSVDLDPVEVGGDSPRDDGASHHPREQVVLGLALGSRPRQRRSDRAAVAARGSAAPAGAVAGVGVVTGRVVAARVVAARVVTAVTGFMTLRFGAVSRSRRMAFLGP